MRAQHIVAGLLVFGLPSAYLGAAEELKASHILVRTQDEADQIRNEIMENGGSRESFMTAARKHSKDATTKRAGGTLGWFTRPKMVREFSDAAFDLKKGEISQPVQTQHGWHLILLEDRREMQGDGQRPNLVSPAKDPHEGHDHAAHAAPPPAPPNVLAPGAAAAKTAQAPSAPGAGQATPPAGQAAAVTPPVEAPPRVTPQKPKLAPRSLVLTVDIKQKRLQPIQVVDVELTLANRGEEAQKVLNPELLPLGLNVTGELAPQAPPATWDDLKAQKPDPVVLNLTSRRAVGGTFVLNDYFKDLPPNGRYRLSWRPQLFFANLEKVFPEIAAQPEVAALRSAYTDPQNLRVEGAGTSPRARALPGGDVVFSIFEHVSGAPGKKYYAQIELDRYPGQMILFELFSDRQLQGVTQFANLALEGFYDNLQFFDIQKGNYWRGGCPRNSGAGAPEMTRVAQNSAKIPHEKGTLSMITRDARGGTKEVGSIFFISRKPQPDWDAVHVPIGKVVQGEDLLDKVEALPMPAAGIRRISVLRADQLSGDLAQAVPPATPPGQTPGTEAPRPPVRPPSTAKIMTPKGELTVELFEDDAPNAVANFVDLTEKGYFNPDPASKKEMTFYSAVPGMAVITGSPTNDPAGNPGYRLSPETAENKRKHEKGTLSLLLELDPVSGNPVPDTAGSQFMICLKDVPAWDGIYIPFGKVTAGQEVLDKIGEGDKIESVTITQKRNRQYFPRKAPGSR